MKKRVNEKATAIADLLMSKEMQSFLSEQGSWPGSSGVPIGDTIVHNDRLKNWQGWDAYLKEVSEHDKFAV